MPAVFSDDAYNRYRITHPDKDLRPLLRRIHKLPLASSTSPSSSSLEPSISASAGSTENQDDGLNQADEERERELTRIEVLKWKIQVERLMACARNLERQGERYKRRAEETTRRAAELEATLEDEKRLLATKLKERDHMIRCDEVYARITARPKSKEELEDQIITLQAQIETHRSSHTSYLEIVQRRVHVFAAITPIVDDVKAMKLPTEVFPETTDDATMDIDPTPSTAEPSASLSGAALPFQPTTTTATTSTSTRKTPVPPPTSRAASHALPHRPSRKSPSIPTAPSGRGTGSRATSASLPQRPSGLRSSATPGRNLEEGEVEGEEGELDDRKLRGGRRR